MNAALLVGLVVVAALARENTVRRGSAQPAAAISARSPGRHPLRYRVWAGLSLWFGASALDLTLVISEPSWWSSRDAGALSLIGFVLAFAWAMFSPGRR